MNDNIDSAIDHTERAIDNLHRLVQRLQGQGRHPLPSALVGAWIGRLERQMNILRRQRAALAVGDTRRVRQLFVESMGFRRDSGLRRDSSAVD